MSVSLCVHMRIYVCTHICVCAYEEVSGWHQMSFLSILQFSVDLSLNLRHADSTGLSGLASSRDSCLCVPVQLWDCRYTYPTMPGFLHACWRACLRSLGLNGKQLLTEPSPQSNSPFKKNTAGKHRYKITWLNILNILLQTEIWRSLPNCKLQLQTQGPLRALQTIPSTGPP